MDQISPEHRSWNMSRIRGKDTKPELRVRSVLHAMGYRFRLHRKDLPGTPDIVLPRHWTVIMVHGCFWHRHPKCKYAYTPKSRKNFWTKKFSETMSRDKRNRIALEKGGWTVRVIWECETPNLKLLEKQVIKLFKNESGRKAR